MARTLPVNGRWDEQAASPCDLIRQSQCKQCTGALTERWPQYDNRSDATHCDAMQCRIHHTGSGVYL